MYPVRGMEEVVALLVVLGRRGGVGEKRILIFGGEPERLAVGPKAHAVGEGPFADSGSTARTSNTVEKELVRLVGGEREILMGSTRQPSSAKSRNTELAARARRIPLLPLRFP